MILLDLSHTAHTHSRTGVQRVCRELFFALQRRHPVCAVTFDPFREQWRELEKWELANLRSTRTANKRSAQWPLGARWRGRLARLSQRASSLPEADALLVPEIFSPKVEAALPRLRAHCRGASVAVFHDAIALQFPELSSPRTVARFPAYLQALTDFAGVAAVSNTSLQVLRGFWGWSGAARAPATRTVPLGISLAAATPAARSPHAEGPRRKILCVGSIEGRKNHVALLDAVEELWAAGLSFELRLIGLAQRETGAAALAKIEALQRAGRPLRYEGAVDDTTLADAYAACDFTVYPSHVEGFGLPVLESLKMGRPCVCSGRGALGEAAAGGGCVTLDRMDLATLANAIRRLLEDPALLGTLAEEAGRRNFRTWDEYADELASWTRELSTRAAR